ncbi:MAG: UDP-3-O-(3-hydroxymyristoyl)glucosamine N-acyltransferase [Planctomycetes bacterium]|nr:UDP-3-O-(3-hydroxymyristoyl)glucosamine N-acyltransferase [Planctomycetota bacterium]
MPHTLSQVCETLRRNGISPELVGDPNREIRGVATLEDACDGEIAFLSNPKYEKALQTTRAAAVVVKLDADAPDGMNLIRVSDPYAAITVMIVELYGYRRHRRVPPGPGAFIHPSARVGPNATIHPGATIDEDVVIGADATIYPGCYVGPRTHIGDRVLLFPNVVIYDDTRIGDRVTIHAGSVIGEDGLGYAPVGGKWIKIPQIGTVEIGDDVEIGSNCSIDRATLGRTRIGSGTKFSNLIAIGHGTQIGAHCLFVAQVGLAGSVSVGDHVTMAGQAGIVGHIRIGDNATVGAKAGVTNNVPDGQTVLGQPAIPIRDMRRQVALIGRLPEMNETIRKLEKRIAELESQLGASPRQ